MEDAALVTLTLSPNVAEEVPVVRLALTPSAFEINVLFLVVKMGYSMTLTELMRTRLVSGGKWSKNGASAGTLNVTSNQASGPNNSKGAFWNVKDFGPDLEVFATFAETGIGASDFFGFFWSFVGAANSDTWSAYWLIYYGNGGSPQIRIRTVNNPTVVDILTINQTLNDGDQLWVIQEGGIIYLYGKVLGNTQWDLLGQVADTTYYRAGKLGIRGIGVTNNLWRLDDFGGGNWGEVKLNLSPSTPEENPVVPFKLTPSAVEFPSIVPVNGVLDNFNRANETPLSFGGKWFHQGASGINLSSNVILATSTTKGVYWNPTQFPQDQEAYVTIPTLPGSGEWVNVLLNLIQPSPGTSVFTCYECGYIHGSPGTMYIATDVNGIGTWLTSASVTLAAGDKIYAKNENGIISLYYFSGGEWRLGCSVADTTYQRTGNIGIRINGTVARVDDFGGGSIGYLLTETGTVTLGLIPSGVDVPGLGSTGTENFKLTPDGIDITNVNVGTEDFKLTPSVSETILSNDVGTENFKFYPSGDEPQYGLIEALTIPFKFSPTAIEFEAHSYSDTATEILKLIASGHDCFAIVTPNYDVEIMKRWNMGMPFDSWEVTDIRTRWTTYIVGTSFDIPC